MEPEARLLEQRLKNCILTLHEEVIQQPQKGALLQSELDATRVALGIAKAERAATGVALRVAKAESATKQEELENKLLSVDRERCAALRELEEKRRQMELDKYVISHLRAEVEEVKMRAEGDRTAWATWKKQIVSLRQSGKS
ncbi:unnamed protein product [Calypogeia fissa]